MNATQHGFTLWELMIALAVAGIVLALGVPNFMEFQRNNSMTAAANELLTGVFAARAEAVKRQVPVTLCATPNAAADPPACGLAGSEGAFIVFVDENGNNDPTDSTDGNAEVDTDELVLLRREAPTGQIGVWMDSGYLTYASNGFPRRATGKAQNPVTVVLYCDDRGNRTAAGATSAARVVQIETTGRGEVRTAVEDIADAVAALDALGVEADCDEA